MASIGAVSNPDQQNIKIGKAGRNRWLGRRPHVRGVVMNPVDHPHGGGEERGILFSKVGINDTEINKKKPCTMAESFDFPPD